MKSLIALTGRKGSGKSTLARLLVDEAHYVRLPITGALKAMLAELLRYQDVDNYEINQFLDGAWKEKACPYLDGRTPRHAMQTLGSEWRKLISEDLWVNIWERAAMTYDKIVVEDVRFVNEVERIRRFEGSFVIRIFRRNQSDVIDLHPSETELFKIHPDIEIWNDQEPEHMLSQLRYTLGDSL